MDLTKLSWTERQEINESNPTELQNGTMNKRVRQIKKKYDLTNKELVKLFNENRKIMPDPKYWV